MITIELQAGEICAMEDERLNLTIISEKNYELYEGLLPEAYRIAFRRNPEIYSSGSRIPPAWYRNKDADKPCQIRV